MNDPYRRIPITFSGSQRVQFLYLEKHCVESTEIIHTLRESLQIKFQANIWQHNLCTMVEIGNTVNALKEPLLDQAYMHLLTYHISLSTKIHHNKL